MYESISHSLLNEILNELKPEIRDQELHHFYTRLGANFYSIYTLFSRLYGTRSDLKQQFLKLVETLARQYIARPTHLKKMDLEREKYHTWYLSQKWVGMTLYADGFAEDLQGVKSRVDYFEELGVNLVHIMPLLKCPEEASDGGYAVSNFREINQRFGTMQNLRDLAAEMRKRDILLVLDVVVNHTSDEHEWALMAKLGEKTYQDYYYTFETRDIPDMFEETLPEVFPEHAPGNFTWVREMGRWVMTVFHNYQWDLNYSNPAVFIEMLDVLLYWANQGVDILRLDAVAFLWKKIGSNSQNEREAHLILQLFKDCCQVTAPGVLFIAEAIVAPVEIVKYFGEDAVNAKECELAYNATLMALLWDAAATKNAKLLTQGIKNLPGKLDGSTWLNYVRCHDDIGLGFSDEDIHLAGYNPRSHRQFLIDYFTGKSEESEARGLPFGENQKNSTDTRISGTLTSLIGLENALEEGDSQKIDILVKHTILLYNIIFSFGGVPLVYYGDELGTVNDYSYVTVLGKANDTRWAHRPKINWQQADLRNTPGTIQYKIFSALKRMTQVRKEIPEFEDFNNRELIDMGDEHIFTYFRFNPYRQSRVLVISNFGASSIYLDLAQFDKLQMPKYDSFIDLYTGKPPAMFQERLVLSPYQFYWLANPVWKSGPFSLDRRQESA
jgi:amylosucrase